METRSRVAGLAHELKDFIFTTNLNIPLAGFLLLAALNATTFLVGPATVLAYFQGSTVGAVLANFVFDSPGTLAGLLGSILLFAPVLLGTPTNQRKSLSAYFLFASIGLGVASSLFWDIHFGNGPPSYGASGIDISAQSIIFTLSIFGIIQSFYRNDVQTDRYVKNSFRIIYATLIVTTIWFIIFLEPIFVPTTQYNWRVHEIAFLLGITLTTIYYAAVNIRARKRNDSKAIQLNPIALSSSRGEQES